MKIEKGFRRGTVLGRWALAVLALAACAAHADGTWADCERDSTSSGNNVYQYFPPATIFVGRDSQPGDPIGPWLTSANPTAWRCVNNSALQGVGSAQLMVQGYPPYARRAVKDFDGEAYAVYAGPGTLDYIARWRFTVNGQTSDWTPLTIATGGQQIPPMSFTITAGDSSPFFLGVDVQIRLLRGTGAVPTSVGIRDPIYVRHYQTAGSSTSAGSGSYRIAQLQSGVISIISGGTCTTPDVNVSLPTVPSSAFSGIGSIAATTPFDLKFNDCPGGLSSIGYSFAPTTSVVNASQGVVALAATSTASGVGIQLAQEDGTPVIFNTVYPLTSYDSTQMGSYIVPMQASLYQTEPSVSGGSVSSSVTFTLDYK